MTDGQRKKHSNRRKTTEEFVREARQIHGDRYLYNQAVYVTAKVQLKIVCSLHGLFWQKPEDHLQGMGCPKCGVERRAQKRTKSTAQFIQEAKQLHKDRYEYDQTEYRNAYTKVEIRCRIHGPFFQLPPAHLKGHGCPLCGRQTTGDARRKTREQFIAAAQRVHKGLYSYDAAIYKNNYTPLKIRCQTHGLFSQLPANHLKGYGCPKCASKRNADKRRWTISEFIAAARKVHGDRYEYDAATYVNSQTPIQIRCAVHGLFRQKPSNHVSGDGCRKCAQQDIADRQRYTTEQFIDKARQIHGDRYSYEQVHYLNSREPVAIECRIHGIFKQSPSNHLKGQNCPECCKPKVDTKVFIERARQIHGDRFSYERVNYSNNSTPVEIVCRLHGVFKQQPSTHLLGYNCPRCSRRPFIDTAEFINRARKVHSDRYDYSQSVYKGSSRKLKIICREHGAFYIKPTSHWKGIGCNSCREKEDRERRKALFLEKARQWHKNRYGYEQVDYIDGSTKVTIICPIHGPFEQLPHTHAEGHGCLECYRDLQRSGYYNQSSTTHLNF